MVAHMNAASSSPVAFPLWDRLRHSFARAFGATALFVARIAMLSSDSRRAILARLRMIECYLRKLLLVEASALPALPATAPRARAVAPRARRPSHPVTDFTKPETWSASFRLALPRSRDATPNRRGAAPSTNSYDNAFRIALRLEAVRRVLNDPTSHARRLRRTLIERPHDIRRYALRAPRRYVPDASDNGLTLDITSRVLVAIAAFDSS